MFILIAGGLAAGAAFLINRWVFEAMGDRSIYLFTPIVEEFLKTGLALLLATPIILTHLVFGLIEGAYDLITAPKKQISAAIISVISHLFFGSATVALANNFNIFIAVFVSILLHASWNGLVVKLASRRKLRKLS
ncbi:MAG: hypothetical protein SCK28_10140 [Bacillota bacterium]|nr:hypothetical protein [Bacillota bacterium]